MVRLVSFIRHTTWIIYIVSAKNEEDAFSQISILPFRTYILRSLCLNYTIFISHQLQKRTKHKHLGQPTKRTQLHILLRSQIHHVYVLLFFFNSYNWMRLLWIAITKYLWWIDARNYSQIPFIENRKKTLSCRLYVSHIISYVCYFSQRFCLLFHFPLSFSIVVVLSFSRFGSTRFACTFGRLSSTIFIAFSILS